MVEGTKLCNKLWSYQEVRRLADLSVEEIAFFEDTMATLSAAAYCDIRQVSGPVLFSLIVVNSDFFFFYCGH